MTAHSPTGRKPDQSLGGKNMARGKKIRIRPYIFPDLPDLGPRLSIEVNGRIYPMAESVEIVGEIIATQRGESILIDMVDTGRKLSRDKSLHS